MQSSKERETRVYYRNAFVCFACVGVCLFFDIRKYIHLGHFEADSSFFISLILYALLIVMGIFSIRKARKRSRDEAE